MSNKPMIQGDAELWQQAFKLALKNAETYEAIAKGTRATTYRKGADIRAYVWRNAASYLLDAMQLENLPITQS